LASSAGRTSGREIEEVLQLSGLMKGQADHDDRPAVQWLFGYIKTLPGQKSGRLVSRYFGNWDNNKFSKMVLRSSSFN
jgi:hypothetical protein